MKPANDSESAFDQDEVSPHPGFHTIGEGAENAPLRN